MRIYLLMHLVQDRRHKQMLKFEEDKKYISREGEVVTLVNVDNSSNNMYPLMDALGTIYARNGKYFHEGDENPKDLVAEYETASGTTGSVTNALAEDSSDELTVEKIEDAKKAFEEADVPEDECVDVFNMDFAELEAKIIADSIKSNTQRYMDFHAEICERMKAITKAKNADYTGEGDDPFANFKIVELNGITSTERGFLVRMSDKMARITSFVQKGTLEVKDESVQDTLMDLANYCILMMGYINSKKGKNNDS